MGGAAGWVPSHWAISGATPASRPWPASWRGNSRSAPEVAEDRAAVGVPGPAALNCSAMYTHSVSPSAVGVGQLAERPGDELAGALLVLKASVTSWTSANPATRRSGRRDIS